MKEGARHYHFYATPPKHYAQQSTLSGRDEQLGRIIRDYTEEMENKLKKYPYQWFNYYDFWSKPA
jgi:predicted LPLAT superfamily acyltransferase